MKNTKNLCGMKIVSNWMKWHVFFSLHPHLLCYIDTSDYLYKCLWVPGVGTVCQWYSCEHSPVYYHFNSIFCSASVIGQHVTPGAMGKEQAMSAVFSFLFQANAQEWCHNAALWIKNCKKRMKLIVYEVLSKSWVTLISSLSFPQKEW